MKKRGIISVIIGVCSAFLCAFGLMACSDDGAGAVPAGHQHSYSANWSANKSYHWHECECGRKSSMARHEFEENVCTVCEYDSATGKLPEQDEPDPAPGAEYKTVTFDPDGGSNVDSQRYVVGAAMSDLTTPERDGFDFLGWFDEDGTQYTTSSLMPDHDVTLIASWEKTGSGDNPSSPTYSDEYATFADGHKGVKKNDETIIDAYGNVVDEFVYIELKEENLDGEVGGDYYNYTVKDLVDNGTSPKTGYEWTWYNGTFGNLNGAQRFTLGYGHNTELVTVTRAGTVVKTYLVDLYVMNKYTVYIHANLFDDAPYKNVTVEEDACLDEDIELQTDGFEFDSFVYYDESDALRTFDVSTPITNDTYLFQTYKAVSLTAADLDGGTLTGTLEAKPYTRGFTLPSPVKEGYDFLGWQTSKSEFLTNVEGHSGINYISAMNYNEVKSLTAVWSKKKMFYEFIDDELSFFETVPVVVYTDYTMHTIRYIGHVVKDTPCFAPPVVSVDTDKVFCGWQRYDVNYNALADYAFESVSMSNPIALVPNKVLYPDSDPLINLNEKSGNYYSSTDDFVMYLPTNREYTLKVTSAGNVDFSISYDEYNWQQYHKTSSEPMTVTLNSNSPYVRGWVYVSVTSMMSSYKIELTGPTAVYSEYAVVTNDENTAEVGEEITVEPSIEGYTVTGIYNGSEKISDNGTVTVPSRNAAYDVEQTPFSVTLNYDGIAAGQDWVQLSFDMNGVSGTAPETQVLAPGDMITYPVNPTSSGRAFAGWYESPDSTGEPFDFTQNITRNTTLYAKWISYSGAGVLSYNSSITVFAYNKDGNTREYYAFVAPVSGNVTFYASANFDTYGYLYDSNKNQIAYNDDGGTNNNFSITHNVTAGVLYYLRACAYNSSNNGNSAPIYVSGPELPQELGTADLSRLTLNGDPYLDPVNITAGTQVGILAEVIEGYTFVGWYDGETLLSHQLDYDFDMPAANVSYTAKWIECPVTLEKNIAEAGSVTMSDALVYGMDVTATATTNSGYEFLGWYNGNELLTTDTEYTFVLSDAAVTYTAKWQAI